MKKTDSSELFSYLQKNLGEFTPTARIQNIGKIIQIGDGVARASGLSQVAYQEIVQFDKNTFGLALNLEKDNVGIVILGKYTHLKAGDSVKTTGKILQIGASEDLVGRVIDPLGRPLDGKPAPKAKQYQKLERVAPSVIYRKSVDTPLQTGIMAIDSMIPIGRGQRELIIGDRSTGKTVIALDTIINQKGKGVYCIYCAIGQKLSSIVAVNEVLKKYGAMDYTTIVSASSRTSASLQYLAPYAATAIAEEFMYSGKHVLVIYDDLSKHAQAYRQLSLLLRRPPGREAYPGDIFYLHSRLLERSAKLNDALGAGSITAIPIIETQAGDISSYIPTNVISITDGQIYLESDLFYAGVRPAVNVGLSVSRVGGKAQSRLMRQVASKLRLDLAQYRELVTFTQFGTDLDKTTRAQLTRGERMIEVLKQAQYEPLTQARQIIIIYAGTSGQLDDLPVNAVRKFEKQLYKFIEEKYPGIQDELTSKNELDEALKAKLDNLLQDFKRSWLNP